MASAMHIHIGGAGIKIGDFIWRLYEKEKVDVQKLNHIYTEDSEGNYSPNVLFADLDYDQIDQVKNKKYNNFRDNSFVKGKEDAADNYGRGFYTIGRQIIDQSLDSIRKQIEEMDYFEQFIITSSISGGTGSGFGSLLLQRLIDEYSKKQRNAFLLYPSQHQSNNVVESYNVVLSVTMTVKHCDSVIVFDNESMYNVIDKYMELDFIDYNHLNNIISQVISSYTGLQRFNGVSNTSILNALIPFPNLHFITPSYGQLSLINDFKYKEFTESQILQQITDKGFKLFQCDKDPIPIASGLIQRERIVDDFYGQQNSNVKKMKDYFQAQCAIYQCRAKNYQILPEIKELKQTKTFFSNDALFGKRLQQIANKYDRMFLRKQAFFPWFCGEGVESGEMYESKYDFDCLIKEYESYQGFNQAP